MAKKSSIEKNLKRERLAKRMQQKRSVLSEKVHDKKLSLSERFALVVKLSEMPRNSARSRVRNRCLLTGRPRGVYRKFKMSRNMLREMAGWGMIPGLIKSSW